ncbi:MAG TPA: ORC1-type DNA replication protein, partial [Methanobacterium sp.]|nr:ORC1-type DNA replication protein [Methanobacterium sp.]
EYSDKIICVYINCQLHTTRYNIFSQIYQKIFGHLPPETGIPVTRIYEKIMKHLKNNDQALVVALDDVNYLFHSKNANKIFYDILRAYEEFDGVRTGLFAIISDIEFRYILDKNVKSVFMPREVTFEPYTYGEMGDILKERVKAGFYPDVISDKILDEVTENTSSIGDLRAGIELLGVLGNIAEADASRIIEEKHLKTAIQNTSSISLKNTLQNLQKKEKTLLELIITSEDEQLTAGNLYKQLDGIKPLSYASFDRLLNKLEFLRLIDVKFTGKGSKGNSRIIILRFDSEEIGKCIL